MSPVLDERHDFAHPVEGDSAWSESYYFNCYCPDTDAGFFTRIGVRPNEGTIDFCLRMMDEAEVSLSPGRGFGEEGEGHLRLAIVENAHRLRQAVRQIGRCLKTEPAPAS